MVEIKTKQPLVQAGTDLDFAMNAGTLPHQEHDRFISGETFNPVIMQAPFQETFASRANISKLSTYDASLIQVRFLLHNNDLYMYCL
jgi:hypothetical protein